MKTVQHGATVFHTLGSAKDIEIYLKIHIYFGLNRRQGNPAKQIDCQLNVIDQPSETCVVRKL